MRHFLIFLLFPMLVFGMEEDHKYQREMQRAAHTHQKDTQGIDNKHQKNMQRVDHTHQKDIQGIDNKHQKNVQEVDHKYQSEMQRAAHTYSYTGRLPKNI